jgi:nucleotide-binding universal stress UspA family protein
MTKIRYKRLFVGMDCSPRSEFVLPFAISLAQFHKSQIVLECVVERPQAINRFPLSEEDTQLINKFVERDYQAATHYFKQLLNQFPTKELRLKAHVSIGENAISVLHDLAEESNADLVMLVAHGYSGERRWPYGSVTTSFIVYGNTSLMIMQDLPDTEIHPTRAEMAVREGKGH